MNFQELFPMRYPASIWIILVSLIALFLLQGCATPPRQPAVPEKLQNQAQIPGLENVRYRIGNPDDLAEMAREGMESVQREQAFLAASGHQGPLPPAVYLAISGGGTTARSAPGY